MLYPDQWLCNDVRCAVADGGDPLYYDKDHLTILGALRLEDMLRPTFSQEDPSR